MARLECCLERETSGSFRVKSTNFQEMQHDPSQMFPKKLINENKLRAQIMLRLLAGVAE